VFCDGERCIPNAIKNAEKNHHFIFDGEKLRIIGLKNSLAVFE
jgi:hypothetical protein